MGAMNIDRIPAVRWRSKYETVGEMIAGGWDVMTKCHVCGLMMRTNLRLVAHVNGADTSLWNVKARCRRIGCPGFVDFLGRPPQLHRHMPLQAEWPPHKPPRNPSTTRPRGR